MEAHERIDRAVHDAYGWSYPLDPDEVLTHLVALNLARSADEEPQLPVALVGDPPV
jgi:hypothetical protein